LFVKGQLGISIFSKKLLGKVPFSISLTAACINGKQTMTASFKSLSQLTSFFLKEALTYNILDRYPLKWAGKRAEGRKEMPKNKKQNQ
jgi:hypothetical protein